LSILQAVILGIVQGLGEFLPISSSAHLVLAPWLFGWEDPGLTFDVALHMGTLLAVVFYFWRDWLTLLYDGLRFAPTKEGRLFWYLVVATVPGAFFGYFMEKWAETTFRTPVLVGIMLIVMGVILWLVDSKMPKRKRLMQINLPDSIWIGISQGLAIIPGVSRAGITMTAGRFRGLDREAAARFSFLLSLPIILGAGVMQLGKINPAQIDTPFLTGMIVSAVVGFLSIGFLLRYLTRHNFGIFVWYRLLLGATVVILALLKQ